VADEDLGFLYVAEENHGIYKYAAEPDRPTTRLATVDVIGPASPLLADLEGLTLYYRRDGLGYLIASSQGNNCFAVYRREAANAYLGTFAIANVSNTDGIDVTNLSLGADYADGLFVAQTRDTHFVMVRWQDIANGLGLAIDPTGHGVRLQVDCSAATSMTLTAAASTLDVGANAQWGVAVTDSTGGPLAGCAVGWSSSDPAVASVSAFGLVHAVAPGAATIRAEVGFASAESLLTVVAPVNHPPVVTLAALSSQTEGSTLSLSASFADAAADQHTAVIDWGDGTFNTGTVDPVLRKVTGSHLFATAGTYTITVTVTDNQGASGQATTTLQVTNRPVVACYASFSDKGSAGGVAFANEDILAFDGAVWSLFFDGSDVGLSSQTIDAFQVIGATQVLLSFTDPATVGGMAVDDSDIVRFNATSLGSVTAGTFSMYFDASDVDLSTSDEDLDGVELLPDGRLLLSTLGAFAVPGAAGAREDLVAFRPITLGATTAGTFELYFDGSDVGLTSSSENIDAVAVDAAGRLHLSTNGSFAVPGVSGADEDVFIFTPTTTGATTAGTFSSALFFDGSLFGLTANDLAGIDRP